MKYTLKHKDKDIAYFTYEGGKELENICFNKENLDYLPLELKGLLVDKQGNFITGLEDNLLILNEEGEYYFNEWLKDRAIPVKRYDFLKDKEEKRSNVEWMLSNNSLSFTDCYWTVPENDNLKWENARLKPEKLERYVNISGNDSLRNLIRHNSANSLGGELDKFWYADEDNILMLHKQAPNNPILCIREYMASEIYRRQDIPHTEYTLSFQDGYVTGCDCRAFTDKDTELITAYALMEEYKLSQLDDTYNIIADLAEMKGLDRNEVCGYMDAMLIVDYLITDRDRHLGNLGFLRDAETLEFKGFAPIYDSGSSVHYEDRTTEKIEGTAINGLYPTETECLKRVHDFNVIDLSKLPDIEEYKNMLKSGDISERRIEELCRLYMDKIEYIRGKQKSRPPYNLEYEYLAKENIIRNIIAKEYPDIKVSFENGVDGHLIHFACSGQQFATYSFENGMSYLQSDGTYDKVLEPDRISDCRQIVDCAGSLSVNLFLEQDEHELI